MVDLGKSSKMPLPRIICGFPGVGKSTLVNGDSTGRILDSDSSKFDKSDFPRNYIEHITRAIADFKTVLASTHADVRKALVENDLPFVLVYPALNCRDEYIQRYIDRGSPEAFIKLMREKWVDFVVDCSSQKNCYHVCLGKGEYLTSLENIAERLNMKVNV